MLFASFFLQNDTVKKGKIKDKCWYLLFYDDTLMKNKTSGRLFENKQKDGVEEFRETFFVIVLQYKRDKMTFN